MAFNFPNSPTNLQIFTTATASGGTVSYQFNTTKNSWYAITTSTQAYSTFASVEVTAGINTTTFSVTNGYVVGQLQVWANGVMMGSADYSATDGSTVRFNRSRLIGDVIRFVALSTPISTPSGSVYTVQEITATANGQTAYTSNYTTSSVQVFLNGVQLNAGDYSATNGTSVTLTSGAGVLTGNIVKVISYNSISLIGALSLSGGTVNGSVNVVGTVRQNNVSVVGLAAAFSVALS